MLDSNQDDMFDDEDAKADPMYSIDLVKYLSDHLQVEPPPPAFPPSCSV